jgi:hypothetical protein
LSLYHQVEYIAFIIHHHRHNYHTDTHNHVHIFHIDSNSQIYDFHIDAYACNALYNFICMWYHFWMLELYYWLIPHHQDYWIIRNYVAKLFSHHRDSHHQDYKTMNAWIFHRDSTMHNIQTTQSITHQHLLYSIIITITTSSCLPHQRNHVILTI